VGANDHRVFLGRVKAFGFIKIAYERACFGRIDLLDDRAIDIDLSRRIQPADPTK
jgi:hypothetical protein